MAGTNLLEMQLMDQRLPRANCLVHTLRLWLCLSLNSLIPCVLTIQSRPSIRNIKKRKNTLVADLESEINAMTLAYAAKLGSVSQNTNVGTQKIDGSESLSSPFPIQTYGL